MRLAFDHLVHVVHDPKLAVSIMQKHGFHAVEGGRHEQWGTYNALCYFDLSYIEFLGIENISLASRLTDNDLVVQAVHGLAVGEGLIGIAFRTNDIEQVAEYVKSKGHKVRGPLCGSRTRPDGSIVKWSMLFPEPHSEKRIFLPFIIQWEQSDSDRRKDLFDQGLLRPHRLGTIHLEYVACAVRDLQHTVTVWSDLFDLKIVDKWDAQDMAAHCVRMKLSGGDLIFCSPSGRGIVSEVLDVRGERPFLVGLTGNSPKRDIQVLGSYYRIEPNIG
jgi:catechol 2,3-dioxygenase-like lactoylglutathione lyase family enzyme